MGMAEAAGLLRDISRSEAVFDSASEVVRIDTSEASTGAAPVRKRVSASRVKRESDCALATKVPAAVARVKLSDDAITATSPCRGCAKNHEPPAVRHKTISTKKRQGGSDKSGSFHTAETVADSAHVKKGKRKADAVLDETASAETKRPKSSSDKKVDRVLASKETMEPKADPKIDALISMGFDRDKCQWALKKRGGRVDRAAELLLSAV